jgi:hypothetical protein
MGFARGFEYTLASAMRFGFSRTSRYGGVLACTSLLALSNASAFEPSFAPQTVLAPADGRDFDTFGNSVALSTSAALVGVPGADRDESDLFDDSGSAALFIREGETWSVPRRLAAPTPLALGRLGEFVAISETIAVAGAPYSDPNQGMGPVDTTDAGLVFAFRAVSGQWSTVADPVPDPAQAAFRLFGRAVATNGDSIFVGAPGYADVPGVVYEFTWSGTAWAMNQELRPPPSVTEGDSFGRVVVVDGTTALVGAQHDQERAADAGAVYVFTQASETWSRGQKLIGSDTEAGDYFGSAVALSGDWAVIGSSSHDDYLGAAYVFRRNVNGVWAETQKLKAPDGLVDDGFGKAVAVSSRGLWVGAPYRNVDDGAVYPFVWDGDAWNPSDLLLPSPTEEHAQLGFALSASGANVLIGAPGSAAYAGRVHLIALGNGSVCLTDSDCSTSYCVEGVCCAELCDNLCNSCLANRKAEGADGVCGPVKAHSNPRGAACLEQPAETCGSNGLCDGAGACEVHAAGTECSPPTCEDTATLMLPGLCDDARTCSPGARRDCQGYGCSDGACKIACESDADCADDHQCTGEQCRPKRGEGTSCDSGRECLSGHCADGVCCDTPCEGQCEACAEPKLVGTCVAVEGAPRGPRSACPAPEDEPCRQGLCDGRVTDQCAGFPGAELVCRAASCEDRTFFPEARCDGSGECDPAAAVDCGNYVCDESSCLTECTRNSDCAPNNYCDGNRCRSGSRCSDDEARVIKADGSEEDCMGYLCSEGDCLQVCSRTAECILGFSCDRDSNRCEPIVEASREADGCSCRVPGRRAAARLELLAALAAAALSALRRSSRPTPAVRAQRRRTSP